MRAAGVGRRGATVGATAFRPWRALKALALYAAVAMAMAYVLAPFLWLVLSSLQKRVDLLRVPPVFPPRELTLQNYVTIFTQEPTFRQGFVNSLIVAGATTIACTLVATLAGYSLARLRPVGQRPALLLILGVQMLPGATIIIPLFIVMRQAGLLNTYGGLIFLYIGFFTPVIIWILRGFFLSIPASLEEAALVDGCNRLQSLWYIVLPLSRAALLTAAIFTFIEAWNEFFFALIIASQKVQTLPIALAQNQGRYLINYELLATGTVLAVLPVVALVLVFQRYVVKGLMEGALKG